METFEDVFPTEHWFSELAGQIRLVKFYSIWPELAMLVYRRVYYLPPHIRQLNKNALPEKSHIFFHPQTLFHIWHIYLHLAEYFR